jgi:hypothetical protein
MGREYMVARSGQHGNVAISPLEIMDPVFTDGAFPVLDGWMFYDGGALVDTGGIAQLASEGNVWRLAFEGDEVLRTARVYVGANHNTGGSTTFEFTADGSSRQITKSTLGRTTYRISVIFTGDVTLEMRVVEASGGAGTFWLAGAADFSVLPTPTGTPVGEPTVEPTVGSTGTVSPSLQPTEGTTSAGPTATMPVMESAESQRDPSSALLDWLIERPFLILAMIGILMLGMMVLLIASRAM